MVSFSCPQAGQLALSVLRNLWRYPFSGKCCSRICAILLAPSRDSLALLIVFRNLVDGAESSIFLALFPLSDLSHS